MSDTFNQVFPSAIESSTRTLRRRRSAASAALLSRPSMLTLGELVPSFETCVLVYSTSSFGTTKDDDGMDVDGESVAKVGSGSTLVYALFEPNFLVDGSSRSVIKLDRSTWERLRSHVEELRIVALPSRYGEYLTSPPPSPISTTNMARQPDCSFDLTSSTTNPDDPPSPLPSSKIISHLYLQPKSYTSIPAKSQPELLHIEIHSPNNHIPLAHQSRVADLPTQVRTILHDANHLNCIVDQTPLSAPATMEETLKKHKNSSRHKVQDFETVAKHIITLIRPPPQQQQPPPSASASS